MSNTFLPFCKPDQKTQLRKMLHDISKHKVCCLLTLLCCKIHISDITDLLTQDVQVQERNINEALFLFT